MWSANRTTTLREAAVSHPKASSYSAEIIASNDDLLYEILLCLPMKSLIKFKSVSKHWLSLISDPKFRPRSSLIPKPASGLFLECSPPLEFEFVNLDKASNSNPSKGPFRSLAFEDDLCGIEIIQSCNGLLLCSKAVLDYKCTRVYYVYNPTTKQYKKLPPLPTRSSWEFSTVLGVSLAFDPSKTPHYKVVCVCKSRNYINPELHMDIYSSETASWIVTSTSFNEDMRDVRFQGGVFWNGFIHWRTCTYQENYVCFNVDEERLSPMPMPSIPDSWIYKRTMAKYFGESNGHLYFIYQICKSGSTRTSYLNVYEMEVDYSGWFLKFQLDLLGFSVAVPNITPLNNRGKFYGYEFSILCFVRGEVEEGESYFVMKIRNKIIRYNFKTRTCNEICDVESGLYSNSFDDQYVHQYIESFAFV